MHLGSTSVFRSPLSHQGPVNHVNGLFKKRASPSCRIRNLDYVRVRLHALRDLEIWMSLDHLAPGGCVRQSVRKAELCLNYLVH